jgi:hypothetical protein
MGRKVEILDIAPIVNAYIHMVQYQFDHSKFYFLWEGPKDGIVGITLSMLATNPEIVTKMPFTLKMLGITSDVAYYQRKDTDTDVWENITI